MGITIITIILGIFFFWLLSKNSNSIIYPKERILPFLFIPKSMSGYNVRSRIKKEDWQRICQIVHLKNIGKQWHCQICKQSGKSQGYTHPVECHEVWEFDRTTKTQKLVDLQTLCPYCHKFTHLGFQIYQAKKDGNDNLLNKIIKHGKKVNGFYWWTSIKPGIDKAFDTSKELDKYSWKLDLTYLNQSKFRFLGMRFTNDEKHNCSPKPEYD